MKTLNEKNKKESQIEKENHAFWGDSFLARSVFFQIFDENTPGRRGKNLGPLWGVW